MTEQQFKARLKTWIDTSIALGVVSCTELIACEEFDVGPTSEHREQILRNIFTEIVVPYAVVALRGKWGGAEQFDLDGAPALRGMIPVDQFRQRMPAPVPGRTLDRATRAYFDA